VLEQIIIIFHVLIALAIVILILLQQGKGADMGASFGGGGSQTLFGPTGGGNLLTQITTILATLFFVTSFSLAIIAKQKVDSLSDDISINSMNVEVNSQAEDTAVTEEKDLLPEFEFVEPDIDEGVTSPNEFSGDIVDSIPE
jgi:preprotein translocase subunit SecG